MKTKKYLINQIVISKIDLNKEKIVNSKLINVFVWGSKKLNLFEKLIKKELVYEFHLGCCFQSIEDFAYYCEINSLSKMVLKHIENKEEKITINFYGESKIKKKFDISGLLNFLTGLGMSDEYLLEDTFYLKKLKKSKEKIKKI